MTHNKRSNYRRTKKHGGRGGVAFTSGATQEASQSSPAPWIGGKRKTLRRKQTHKKRK